MIELVQGDITHQDTDAIVNAANNSLLGGGGVDGAIHRAAGPQLLEETRTLGGCETGDAKISRGYRLKARYVVHAVGPVYRPNHPDVPRLLASAYRRSLEVAAEHDIHSIAFPSISTGVYGYPVAQAAPIAIATVCDFACSNPQFEIVRFVLFDSGTMRAFADALKHLIAQRPDLTDVS
ncbi:MAG: O-acetyl-ADP-ribose deacetylase [Anaerolineae bacterium]|nr:O-acetyl-ADP-ribose deacetylase [Anaerolineae bacterium]